MRIGVENAAKLLTPEMALREKYELVDRQFLARDIADLFMVEVTASDPRIYAFIRSHDIFVRLCKKDQDRYFQDLYEAPMSIALVQRLFEQDVYNFGRSLGLSKDEAEEHVVKARTWIKDSAALDITGISELGDYESGVYEASLELLGSNHRQYRPTESELGYHAKWHEHLPHSGEEAASQSNGPRKSDKRSASVNLLTTPCLDTALPSGEHSPGSIETRGKENSERNNVRARKDAKKARRAKRRAKRRIKKSFSTDDARGLEDKAETHGIQFRSNQPDSNPPDRSVSNKPEDGPEAAKQGAAFVAGPPCKFFISDKKLIRMYDSEHVQSTTGEVKAGGTDLVKREENQQIEGKSQKQGRKRKYKPLADTEVYSFDQPVGKEVEHNLEEAKELESSGEFKERPQEKAKKGRRRRAYLEPAPGVAETSLEDPHKSKKSGKNSDIQKVVSPETAPNEGGDVRLFHPTHNASKKAIKKTRRRKLRDSSKEREHQTGFQFPMIQ